MSDNEKIELSLKDYLDGKFAEVNHKFGEVNQRMDGKFAEVHQRMDDRFSEVHQRMDDRFSEVHQRMDDRFSEVHQRIDDKHAAHEKATEAHVKGLKEKINLMYGFFTLLFMIIVALIAKDFVLSNQNIETAKLIETLQNIYQENDGSSND